MGHKDTVIGKESLKNESLSGFGHCIQSTEIEERSVESVTQIHSTIKVPNGTAEYTAEEQVEEDRGKDISLLGAITDVKRLRPLPPTTVTQSRHHETA